MDAASMALRQRADLTFKHNKKRGRHGWLRLTPAYSVKLVREIIKDHPDAKRIFDPFSGTGTTPLCAAAVGRTGLSVDINPFLVWLGNVKAARYSAGAVARFLDAASATLVAVLNDTVTPCDAPPITNIERWWPAASLSFLCRLKAAIDRYEQDRPVYDLLRVALCRTLIALSNAAFNHQSMSFKDDRRDDGASARQLSLALPVNTHRRQFEGDVAFVAAAAADNPAGEARVLLGDSRDLRVLQAEAVQPFDLLITSPPYPNRMSYIRELRPYMYWLSYLVHAKEAGELDWVAIGGTWGIATSRLKDWKPSASVALPEYVYPVLEQVKRAHEKNGLLMAHYVHKYFEDINEHLRALGRSLMPGATVHYIVGNSTFYGHIIPVEKLYADLMTAAGFDHAGWKVVRKRNSKKELYEFVVSARWAG